ncbi:MAG: NAD-binding protein, partial [Spirochaetota bacterium]
MKNNIVIAGSGTTGFQIAKQLIADKKNVVLIERNPQAARYASNHLDCMVLNEESNSLETLRKAGLNDADFFISVTDSDELNLISCGLAASEFNVPYKIARVRNLDYANTKLLKEAYLKIDYIVNPEIEAAKSIIKSIEQGATSDIYYFEKTNFQMRNILVGNGSFFKDKSVKKIKNELNEDFLIAGISRDEQFIVPGGDDVIRENDHIYLVATEQVLQNIFSTVGRPRLSMRRIIIVGGGKVGSYIAGSLVQRKKSSRPIEKFFNYFIPKQTNLKIIESEYDNCKLLKERFPQATVI